MKTKRKASFKSTVYTKKSQRKNRSLIDRVETTRSASSHSAIPFYSFNKKCVDNTTEPSEKRRSDLYYSFNENVVGIPQTIPTTLSIKKRVAKTTEPSDKRSSDLHYSFNEKCGKTTEPFHKRRPDHSFIQFQDKTTRNEKKSQVKGFTDKTIKQLQSEPTVALTNTSFLSCPQDDHNVPDLTDVANYVECTTSEIINDGYKSDSDIEEELRKMFDVDLDKTSQVTPETPKKPSTCRKPNKRPKRNLRQLLTELFGDPLDDITLPQPKQVVSPEKRRHSLPISINLNEEVLTPLKINKKRKSEGDAITSVPCKVLKTGTIQTGRIELINTSYSTTYDLIVPPIYSETVAVKEHNELNTADISKICVMQRESIKLVNQHVPTRNNTGSVQPAEVPCLMRALPGQHQTKLSKVHTELEILLQKTTNNIRKQNLLAEQVQQSPNPQIRIENQQNGKSTGGNIKPMRQQQIVIEKSHDGMSVGGNNRLTQQHQVLIEKVQHGRSVGDNNRPLQQQQMQTEKRQDRRSSLGNNEPAQHQQILVEKAQDRRSAGDNTRPVQQQTSSDLEIFLVTAQTIARNHQKRQQKRKITDTTAVPSTTVQAGNSFFRAVDNNGMTPPKPSLAQQKSLDMPHLEFQRHQMAANQVATNNHRKQLVEQTQHKRPFSSIVTEAKFAMTANPPRVCPNPRIQNQRQQAKTWTPQAATILQSPHSGGNSQLPHPPSYSESNSQLPHPPLHSGSNAQPPLSTLYSGTNGQLLPPLYSASNSQLPHPPSHSGSNAQPSLSTLYSGTNGQLLPPLYSGNNGRLPPPMRPLPPTPRYTTVSNTTCGEMITPIVMKAMKWKYFVEKQIHELRLVSLDPDEFEEERNKICERGRDTLILFSNKLMQELSQIDVENFVFSEVLKAVQNKCAQDGVNTTTISICCCLEMLVGPRNHKCTPFQKKIFDTVKAAIAKMAEISARNKAVFSQVHLQQLQAQIAFYLMIQKWLNERRQHDAIRSTLASSNLNSLHHATQLQNSIGSPRNGPPNVTIANTLPVPQVVLPPQPNTVITHQPHQRVINSPIAHAVPSISPVAANELIQNRSAPQFTVNVPQQNVHDNVPLIQHSVKDSSVQQVENENTVSVIKSVGRNSPVAEKKEVPVEAVISCKEETKKGIFGDIIDLTWIDDADDDVILVEFTECKSFPIKREQDATAREVVSPTDSGLGSPLAPSDDIGYKCLCGKQVAFLCKCSYSMYCSIECQNKDWVYHQRLCKTKFTD